MFSLSSSIINEILCRIECRKQKYIVNAIKGEKQKLMIIIEKKSKNIVKFLYSNFLRNKNILDRVLIKIPTLKSWLFSMKVILE